MKSYCINLAHRPERWELAQKEFEKIGFQVERFEGIYKKPGFVGCKESHLKILQQNRHEQTFAIFEDDIIFMPNALEILSNALIQLPKKWDLLHLGCNPQSQLKRYSDNLFELKDSYTTHAMILNSPVMVDYILKNRGIIRKIDVYYSDVIFNYFNCYVTWPLVAAQRNGQGDVCKGVTNYYDTITQNFKKFTE